MKKKGVFMAIFPVIVLIVLVALTSFMLFAQKKNKEFELGSTQIRLISKYHEGEKILFNIDQKALYAKYETLNEFSNLGGLNTNCKNINGYYLWEFNTNCEPDFKNNFIELFKDNINNNLNDYQYSNEDFKIESNYIIADTKKDIEIKGSTKNSEFTYKIKPNFKQEIIELDKYEDLKNEIKSNKDCLSKDYNACLSKNLNYKITKEGDLLKFEVDIGKDIVTYDNGIKIVRPVFKFVIDLKNSWKNQLFT